MWYTDDCGDVATFNNLEKYFNVLRAFVPSYGYTPQQQIIKKYIYPSSEPTIYPPS